MSMQTEDFEELPHAIADFFEWFVHQILFYREVYPQESFEMVKFCNYPSYVTDKSCCPSVIDYIREWHSILSATCEPGKMTVVIQIEDPAMRNKLVEVFHCQITNEIESLIQNYDYFSFCTDFKLFRKLLPNWKSFEDSLPDIISRLISVTEVENARHPLITESNHCTAENSEKGSGTFVPLVDGRIVPIGTVASDNMKVLSYQMLKCSELIRIRSACMRLVIVATRNLHYKSGSNNYKVTCVYKTALTSCCYKNDKIYCMWNKIIFLVAYKMVNVDYLLRAFSCSATFTPLSFPITGSSAIAWTGIQGRLCIPTQTITWNVLKIM
ncbi:nucleolar MIF4G domain-containing protein 1 [Trichinella spiralis]|uniref:nucleolar MIF4G domain-containing protein 1 n=1 Tax=Trichinella spiralis TaxID=6334 RepID=UPI0001EFC065|nr:nucleolar MIF4G domain-containing protein 1 [Trichinella spiralis]